MRLEFEVAAQEAAMRAEARERRRQRAGQLRDSGHSKAEIAERLGISLGTLTEWFRGRKQ